MVARTAQDRQRLLSSASTRASRKSTWVSTVTSSPRTTLHLYPRTLSSPIKLLRIPEVGLGHDIAPYLATNW